MVEFSELHLRLPEHFLVCPSNTKLWQSASDILDFAHSERGTSSKDQKIQKCCRSYDLSTLINDVTAKTNLIPLIYNGVSE